MQETQFTLNLVNSNELKETHFEIMFNNVSDILLENSLTLNVLHGQTNLKNITLNVPLTNSVDKNISIMLVRVIESIMNHPFDIVEQSLCGLLDNIIVSCISPYIEYYDTMLYYMKFLNYRYYKEFVEKMKKWVKLVVNQNGYKSGISELLANMINTTLISSLVEILDETCLINMYENVLNKPNYLTDLKTLLNHYVCKNNCNEKFTKIMEFDSKKINKASTTSNWFILLIYVVLT